ncbi:hypothetical protein R1sor_006413 [Riccia sorocarpa]|uniref:F-box domain-containing protein n=1 Tax=Riccia sorocarpa TaxID=122646 RepID=A0ABD3HMJ2_9MARC
MNAGSAKAKKAAKEALIPSVWRHLPVELLERVLTKLSASALKTFSRVSKQWKVLIESEVFALKCDSIEPTLFVVQCHPYNPYIALPNLATDSWDKYDLEFLSGGEKAVFLAANEGLLLYQVYNSADIWAQQIVLIVQNPVSFKWRRFVVPLKLVGMHVKYARTTLLGGLQVDPGTGDFKVVVAFIDCHTRLNTSITPKEASIYDSSSNSWTVSVTESPVLMPQLQHPFLSYWLIGTSVYYGGELYWLVEEWDSYPDLTFQFKSLIKYNITLDTWDMVTVNWPCGAIGDLNFASFQDQLFMVNLHESKEKSLLPPEFPHLAPDLEMFDIGSAWRLLERVGDTFFDCDHDFKPFKAFAEGGAWFLLSEAVPGFVDILLVSNSRHVMPLPRLKCDVDETCRPPLMRIGLVESPCFLPLSLSVDPSIINLA